jgi:hypothetical protein
MQLILIEETTSPAFIFLLFFYDLPQIDIRSVLGQNG